MRRNRINPSVWVRSRDCHGCGEPIPAGLFGHGEYVACTELCDDCQTVEDERFTQQIVEDHSTAKAFNAMADTFGFFNPSEG